jgi:hypothetical protein
MPSKKKKSKARGRKPAAGKGGANKGVENATANEQKKGTLDSEMRRLKTGDKQAGDNEEDALLEQAIKLAAIEEQEIKVKEKENCTHGYNPSSIFQARFCEEFVKTFMESYYASTREGGNNRDDRLKSALGAYNTAITTSTMTKIASRNKSNKQCIHPCCLAEGTKIILDGKSDVVFLYAVLSSFTKNANEAADGLLNRLNRQKLIELIDGDEHTLVQFFRKQIPCSCLDEKYKEVKSIPKMGVCYNGNCPLPGNMVVRSKMLQCTGCCDGYCVSYCSRECQEAHWPHHKEFCGEIKTAKELAAMHSNK